MKIGLLFAGQGSQYVGMGKELAQQYAEAKAVYDAVEVGFDLETLCFEGPIEQLQDTAYAQASILTTSLAIAEVVKAQGIHADYVAGLSLGEYSALCYAQAMSISDAANIVRKRGMIMANALPAGTTTMAAVLGAEEVLIKEVCVQVSHLGVCEIANYNCPQQIVISGEVKAIEEASRLLVEQGARRVIPLAVSGAFHSSLLEEASQQLNEVLKTYDLKQPNIPVIYNTTGTEVQDTPIIDLLTKQIKSSVYFMQSIEYMIAQGVDTFIEIGPGSALKGFVRKVSRDVKVYSVQDIKTLEEMLGALK